MTQNIVINYSLWPKHKKLKALKILRKYDYPPGQAGEATITVLEQAKLLGYEWVELNAFTLVVYA